MGQRLPRVQADKEDNVLGVYMYYPPITSFESLAEERAYPIILNACKKLNLPFSYQEGIPYPCDYYDWVYERYGGILPDWLEAKHDCGVGCRFCNFWKDGDIYRIDFVINKTLAVEIDGERWHTRKKDEVRDAALEARGYRVIHFTAKDILYEPFQTEEWLIFFLKKHFKINAHRRKAVEGT